jgi:hypothetical protein
MPDTTTTHYNIIKPDIGGDSNTWGDRLNQSFDIIDAAMWGIAQSIAAKLNSSAYTAADVLAKLKTVDGAGSGLDADLIDGLDSGALGGGGGGGTMSAADILAALKTVDGTGSGLDADSVDGLGSSAFALSGHNHDGTYLKLSGGTVTQNITRQGAGPHIYHNDAAMVSGRIFVTAVGAADPTSQKGDIWLEAS